MTRRVLIGGALATALIVLIVIVSGVVSERIKRPGAAPPSGPSEPAMREYLEHDLPVLVMARYAAASAGQEAEWFPQVSVSHDLRTRVLPLYEGALAKGKQIAASGYVAGTPAASRLNAAYLAFVAAEQAAFAADADATDHPDAAHKEASTKAWKATHDRDQEWQQLWAAAKASVPGLRLEPLPSLTVSARPGIAASSTPSSPAPTQGSASTGWAGQAEAACARVYASRGSTPRSQSGNAEDEMAVFYSWEAALVARAVADLRTLSNAPPEGATLIANMSHYADLSAKAAPIVAAHPKDPQRLNNIMSIMTEQSALKRELMARAAVLGAPSCGKLVNI